MPSPQHHPVPAQPSQPSGHLARLVGRATAAAARRPKLAIALWLLLIVACTAGGTIVGTRNLTAAQSGTGQSGAAMQRMQRAGLLNRFDESLIVTSGSAARTSSATRAVIRTARRTPYVHAVTPQPQSRDRGRAALVQVTLNGTPDQESSHVIALETAVRTVAARHPSVTIGEAGDGSFTRAENATIARGMQHAEMIAVPITLLILVVAFGALVAAVVPLVLGITSVAAALGALGLVSQVAPESSVTASVVILMGLAVGVDYSLFSIRRSRSERAAGAAPSTALMTSAHTVGRAILIAGATVVIGLAGLLFTGSPVFILLALGAIVVVTVAVIGSLTVLPAMLTLLGDRIDRGRIRRRSGGRSDTRARSRAATAASGTEGIWHRIARTVTRRPKVALLGAVLLLTVAATPLLAMRLTNPGDQDLAPGNPTVQAQRLIDTTFHGGTDTAQLVVEGHRLQADRDQLIRLGRRGQRAAGNAGGTVNVTVARGGRTAVINIPVPSGGLSRQNRTVTTLRQLLIPATRSAIPGAAALLTGDDAANVDFNHQMAQMTPIVIAFVLLLALMLLIASFRSPRLAITVVLLNLLSVGAAFGVLTELFQAHWAEHLFGLRSFGAIVDWLPLFAFVVLFGLSMDYTVLILERAREARQHGASAAAAAAQSLGATGATVTSAALVMVAVFATFATVPLVSFSQLGIGLAAAIAIDATIVRGIALPAILVLLGERGLPGAPRESDMAVTSTHDDDCHPHSGSPAWDHRSRVAAAQTHGE